MGDVEAAAFASGLFGDRGLGGRGWLQIMASRVTLRVQVPNNHTLAQNLYFHFYSPKPKYPIIWYLDPMGWYGLGLLGVRL